LLRELWAIRALGSDVAAERTAALEDLASIGTSRAMRGILGSLPLPTPGAEGLFIEEPSGETYCWDPESDSWELRCAVAIYYGRSSLPLLRSALRSTEPRERYWALRFLWRIPDLASDEPGPAVRELLDDPDPRVRSEAVMAVAMSVETKPFLLDLLVEGLDDAHTRARSRAGAAMALSLAALREADSHGSATAVACSAAAALRKAAGDDAAAVRAECARGLCRIEDRFSSRDPALGKGILQLLATRLSEPEPEIRSVIAGHLRESNAIPALIEVLEKGPPDARPGAVEVLRSIGGNAVWRAASDLLERSDDSISDMTEELLSSLDHAKIDHLVQALFSVNLGVRRAAVKVLGRQEQFDNRGLIPLLEHRDPEVRSQAAKALSWSVNIDAGMLEQTVLELLAEARTDLLRRTACEVAPSLGPASVKAVPLLASLIEADPWDGRSSAAAALGDIGPAARAAVPALAAAVRGSDGDLALESIRALSKIAPDHCAEVISVGLRHASSCVRDAAMGALWGLDFAAAPALPALRELARDASAPDLARRAAELVSRLEAAPFESR